MHPFSVAGSPWSDKPKHDSTETVQSVIRFLKTSSLFSNELQYSLGGCYPFLRYGKREAIAYAASRLQACYGATLRVFSEVSMQWH